MTPVLNDNWDQIWSDFSPAADIAPSTAWRRRLIERLVEVDGAGDGVRMLEIGSGRGAFAGRFVAAHPKAEYLGLDMSAIGVAMAERAIPKAEFRVRDLLIPAGPSDDTGFGATHAICSEVLEHLDDPLTLLRNSAAYMAPGCRLVVTVPGGPVSAFHRHIGHRKHYTAPELRELLTRAGFEVQHATGVGFPFFNLYFAALVWRGEKAIQQVSGKPGPLLRIAGAIFDVLFRLNSLRSGWQIVAVARYTG